MSLVKNLNETQISQVPLTVGASRNTLKLLNSKEKHVILWAVQHEQLAVKVNEHLLHNPDAWVRFNVITHQQMITIKQLRRSSSLDADEEVREAARVRLADPGSVKRMELTRTVALFSRLSRMPKGAEGPDDEVMLL